MEHRDVEQFHPNSGRCQGDGELTEVYEQSAYVPTLCRRKLAPRKHSLQDQKDERRNYNHDARKGHRSG